MRYAVLADVHANLEALHAVLEKLRGLHYDRLVFLGDIVGFNANPRECVTWLMTNGADVVAGNHDLVGAGLMEPEGFSPRARTSALWTRTQLLPDDVRYLASLPRQLVVEKEFVACHANLWDAMERINTPERIARMFAALNEEYAPLRICFFAHTHHPSAHSLKGGTVEDLGERKISLDPAASYLINPGSVAESRDRDRRASFIVFDSTAREVEFFRVPYDERTSRRKAVAEGLPPRTRGTRLRRLFGRQKRLPRGPHAVVLGLGVNGLGVVRTLAKKGIPVFAAYEHPREIGRYSRHCEAVSFPEAQTDPEGFLRELSALGARLGDRPVLFPTTDVQIALVSRERETLSKLFRIQLPDCDVLDLLMDKAMVVNAARRYGIAIPQTYTFGAANELRDAPDYLPLPCVVKPRYPWRPNQSGIPKVTVLHSRDEIRRFFERHPDSAADLVFQEVIKGSDADHAFCLTYVNAAHSVAGMVTGESIHRYPPNLGVTASCVTRDLPDLAAAGERFLCGERYVGLAELEFKRDVADGIYRLYEVNTRSWNYNILAAACGADLVHLAYLDATGQPLPAERLRSQPGWAWVNTDFEVGFLWKNLRQGGPVTLPWRILSPRTAHSKFAWDDPEPALRGLSYRLGRLATRVDLGILPRRPGRAV